MTGGDGASETSVTGSHTISTSMTGRDGGDGASETGVTGQDGAGMTGGDDTKLASCRKPGVERKNEKDQL